MPDPRELYLELIKKSLTNWIYAPHETRRVADADVPGELRELCERRGWSIVQPASFNAKDREVGRDWPPTAHTMIGRRRLNNVDWCARQVLRDGVPGDFLEAGVWRGGSCILMRAVLAAFGVRDRFVYVADSFQGLPRPDAEHYPADRGLDLSIHPELAVSLEQVKENFARHGLLDGQVRFIAGWFKDSLPAAPVGPLALLRLDGDLYESTMDALVHLYPKLSAGGYLIVDDYGCVPACQRAVTDYRLQHGIEDEIVPIDWTGVYWRKQSPGRRDPLLWSYFKKLRGSLRLRWQRRAARRR